MLLKHKCPVIAFHNKNDCLGLYHSLTISYVNTNKTDDFFQCLMCLCSGNKCSGTQIIPCDFANRNLQCGIAVWLDS